MHSSVQPSLDPEILRKIRAIQLRTNHLVTEVLAGDYVSAYKGQGMEFEHVREYLAGDDIRHIDWNVTARMNQPFVKVHREERELTVLLLVDLSRSGIFSSSERSKSELAAELAAVLATTAVRSHDKVGLVVFTEHVERYIPPKKGRGHIWRVIREILNFVPQKKGTKIAEALSFANRVAKHRAVIFLISDFFDDHFSDALRSCAARHTITAMQLIDSRDLVLPNVGLLQLRDAESGQTLCIDTTSVSIRNHYHYLRTQSQQSLEQLLKRCKTSHLKIPTDQPYIDNLVLHFRNQRSRRAA